MCVPYQIEVIARDEERLRMLALEKYELPVALDGIFQVSLVMIMW
jgi:hypothetical protein